MCVPMLVSTHVETVVKLSLKKDTPKIEVTMEPDEESNYTPEEKATYQKIKEYVKDKYGVHVHTSYIAQVKRMCGLDMGENYYKSKKENPEVKQCPQEKVEYIKDALRLTSEHTPFTSSLISEHIFFTLSQIGRASCRERV